MFLSIIADLLVLWSYFLDHAGRWVALLIGVIVVTWDFFRGSPNIFHGLSMFFGWMTLILQLLLLRIL